jgi:beta-lactamase superfamily II metal-dependent hydrolase
MRTLLGCALLLARAFVSPARDVEVYFIDVEVGKATLIVSPAGESLLIDTGLPGFHNRDADRIAEAARVAGVARLDNLVITHYHVDHVGGVAQLAGKLPITNFLDHGPTVDDRESGVRLYRTYAEIASRGRRMRVQSGDTIPVKGLEVRIVSASGAVLASPLPGAGQPNSDCAGVHRDYSGSENAQSVGLLVTYDDRESGVRLYRTYAEIASRGRRMRVQPGDTIPVKGLEVRAVSAGGAVLASPLPGAGQPNSDCAGVHRDYSGSENAQSVGLLVTYGEFRLLDLGDLTGDTERQLVCPVNRIGTVTVFVASHHGNDDANSPSLVHAIRPRVVIIANGALDGGAPRAVETLRKAPGLEDIWQLHYSLLGGMQHNAPLAFIANRDQNCKGRWLKLTARRDGSLTVYNAGTGFAKQYGAK